MEILSFERCALKVETKNCKSIIKKSRDDVFFPSCVEDVFVKKQKSPTNAMKKNRCLRLTFSSFHPCDFLHQISKRSSDDGCQISYSLQLRI